jgi:putative FmdB family regulatory protein
MNSTANGATMPTYEYACDACGHRFEEFQSIMAKPITKCPACKKRKVKRLISGGAGFIFKGSGFYITDYRTDNYKAGEKSESGAKNDSKGAAATPAKAEPAPAAAAAPAKTESKPAASSGASSKAAKK